MFELHLTACPADADLALLGEGLNAHSKDQVPPRSKQKLGAFFRDGPDLVAGLYAETYWGWLRIRLLWVDGRYRSAGLGRRLVQAAEAEGQRRGCHAATVDTHSFQAHGFYEKLGYEVFGCLDDFPPGHQRIYLRKSLIGPNTRSVSGV